MISRHSPENCPIFNEKTRKLWLDYVRKSDELWKKHGVKMLGAWTVPNEHLYVEVDEAPSLEAIQNLSMEPEIQAFGAYETWEMKIAYSLNEIAQMLQQAT